MSDLAIDPATGDLLIQRGDLGLVKAAAAVAQDWRVRLTMFKGDYVLDRRVGIDYQNAIFARTVGKVALRHIYETVTRGTAGVQSMSRLDFSVDRQTRTTTVEAVVQTADGTVPLQFTNVLFPADDAAGDA